MSNKSRKPISCEPVDDNEPESDPEFDAEAERFGLDPVFARAFLRAGRRLIEREERRKQRRAAKALSRRAPSA